MEWTTKLHLLLGRREALIFASVTDMEKLLFGTSIKEKRSAVYLVIQTELEHVHGTVQWSPLEVEIDQFWSETCVL